MRAFATAPLPSTIWREASEKGERRREQLFAVAGEVRLDAVTGPGAAGPTSWSLAGGIRPWTPHASRDGGRGRRGGPVLHGPARARRHGEAA